MVWMKRNTGQFNREKIAAETRERFSREKVASLFDELYKKGEKWMDGKEP